MQKLYAASPSKKVKNAFLSPFIFLFALLLPTSSLKSSELPNLGSANHSLTISQEHTLGHAVKNQLRAASLILDDMIINEYLQDIGNRLAGKKDEKLSPFDFFIVKDQNINAFALPGGFIGIHTGTLLNTESESEIASVLAHEIAHVQQKHIARLYERVDQLRLSTLAGIIASLILASQNPELGSGAMAATIAGGQQALINFTREHEKEADYVGIQILAKAGFDPMGMPAFFHRMYQKTRYHHHQVPEYFLTHPLTESRLQAAQFRAKSYPYKQVPDSLRYHLIKIRTQLTGFASAYEANLHFGKMLKKDSSLDTLYGYLLTLIELGQVQTAYPIAKQLEQANPTEPLFQIAYAELEMAAGKPKKALARLSRARRDHPYYFPLVLTLSQWLVEQGEPQKAILILKRQTSTTPLVWHHLSFAYAKAKQPLQAHLTQAKYLNSQGDLEGAKIQLKLARKIAQKPSIQNEIDAALIDIKKKIRMIT